MKTFEVRVEVKQNGSRHFSTHVGMYIERKLTKMFHVDARTPEQAMRRVEKHGRPISVRKADVGRMKRSIENIVLGEQAEISSPYPNAIAMDEMVWRRKSKRAGRIQNRGKDKE